MLPACSTEWLSPPLGLLVTNMPPVHSPRMEVMPARIIVHVFAKKPNRNK